MTDPLGEHRDPATLPGLMWMSATPAQRHTALVAGAVQALLALLLLPFATQPLAYAAPWVAGTGCLALLADLATVGLLVAQCRKEGTPALWLLAATYLYVGALLIPYLLAYSGLFSPARSAPAAGTAAWIFHLWQIGFPLGLLAYAACLPSRGARGALCTRRRCALLALGLVALLVGLHGRISIAAGIDGPAIWGVSLLAAAALVLRTRGQTVAHLWLCVGALAGLLGTTLILCAGTPGTLGWCAAQIEALVSVASLPVAFCYAVSRLYSRLMQEAQQRSAALAALQESEQRCRGLIEASPFGTCITDERGNFEIVNSAYAAVYGYTPDEMVDRHVSMVLPAEEQSPHGRQLGELPGSATGTEIEVVTKQGQRLTVLATTVPMIGADGLPRRASFVVDISERKRIEHYLAHVAHHDALTGLPNRVLFRDRLSQGLLAATRTRAPLALLLIDLDGFKAVNDTLGHAAGDRLLQEIATRMHGAVRASDTVARLGGDEFGVVLLKASEAGSITVANKILDALSRPLLLDGHVVQIGASIGVALSPEHSLDPAELLAFADRAMYAAKAMRCGYTVYTAGEDQQNLAHLALACELRQSLVNGGGLLPPQLLQAVG